jgi:hypothetical protein
MSLSTISSHLKSLGDEMARIQRRIADLSRDEARASQQLVQATRSLASASSQSQIAMYQRNVQRAQEEMAKFQSKRADESGNLARKQTELVRYQSEFAREQQREFQKSQDLMKRLEQESQNRERTIFASVRQQARESAVFQAVDEEQHYGAFISHASEDKEALVRPLAEALIKLGHKIWYDEFSLTVGDSLRRKIDRGLATSRFGIVILSASFLAKNWPQYEFDGLVAKEQEGQKVILPIWHRVSKNDVLAYSPTLADRVALNTSMFTIQELAEKLHVVLSS